jgi:hypothetical protein
MKYSEFEPRITYSMIIPLNRQITMNTITLPDTKTYYRIGCLESALILKAWFDHKGITTCMFGACSFCDEGELVKEGYTRPENGFIPDNREEFLTFIQDYKKENF